MTNHYLILLFQALFYPGTWTWSSTSMPLSTCIRFTPIKNLEFLQTQTFGRRLETSRPCRCPWPAPWPSSQRATNTILPFGLKMSMLGLDSSVTHSLLPLPKTKLKQRQFDRSENLNNRLLIVQYLNDPPSHGTLSED